MLIRDFKAKKTSVIDFRETTPKQVTEYMSGGNTSLDNLPVSIPVIRNCMPVSTAVNLVQVLHLFRYFNFQILCHGHLLTLRVLDRSMDVFLILK